MKRCLTTNGSSASWRAGLWRSYDKTLEARELLTLVYGWFTEGFDSADLTEAKALWQKLS